MVYNFDTNIALFYYTKNSYYFKDLNLHSVESLVINRPSMLTVPKFGTQNHNLNSATTIDEDIN